jgi:hypothetical protein
LSEYQWARDVTPYAVVEAKKWNALEDERWARYNKAVDEWTKNRADVEADAMKKGLNPMELKKRGIGWVLQDIPSGSWWLTCTRKVPGLTYYWQIPLTAAPSEKVKIVLTEMNALVIEGGW